MLAVVVAAALVPNAGAVPAASNCPYGQCNSSPATVPAWEWASIGAIVVLGLLVGLVVVMRRRRRPPAEGIPPAGSSFAPPPGTMSEGPSAPEPEGPASAAYVETPDDIGTAPPALGAPPAAAVGAAEPTPEPEPDIDSLMAELDKISGEILKRTPKKGSSAPPEDEADESPSP